MIVIHDGEEKVIDCDTVIIAAGYDPVNQLEEELEDQVDLTVVGDAVEARKILDAVHEAYHANRIM
ncbi:hypothetical protein ACWY2R_07495 [Enterococcus avium]